MTDHAYFESSSWHHAFTLAERVALLRAVGHTPRHHEADTDLAERRLQYWRSQHPFTNDSLFAQRLTTEGLTVNEFRHLLGEPIESIYDRVECSPAWLTGIADAFSQRHSPDSIPLPEKLHSLPMVGVLDAIEPLISKGRNRLRQGIQTLAQTRCDLPFDPATVEELLYSSLPGQLLTMMSRTMVLELNVARLQGLLNGETAEERFQSFLNRVRDRDTALTILQEYPVLARQLKLCIDRWAITSLEFLQRLCADWKQIRTTFDCGDDSNVLVEVNDGAGDKHCGGRSVLIARFRSGFQVVYKPKSLAVAVHFQELLAWLNARGDHPGFRTLCILDRGTHGWVEFVHLRDCTTNDEVRRFYERQGGYLALLYTLHAADFHCENLIAADEHPMLIDLEALYHPRMDGPQCGDAAELAGNTLYHSVLGVGLLPQRSWGSTESPGVDLSGLGTPAGQLTPHGVPQWEGTGTDEMRLTRKRMLMEGSQNRPTLNGNDVDVLAYAESIIAGFTHIYRLLQKHRDDLLSSDGPLARFAQDEVRVIFRGTRTYSVLLSESFHPDVLRDALDRDRLFDRLWGRVEHCPYLAKVIPAEHEDLQNGDIPMFTTQPGSRDLWTSSHERIADFFHESGMNLVKDRVRRLDDGDLAKQLWIIRASLATLPATTKLEPRPTYCLVAKGHPSADHGRLLTTARAVGDWLDTLTLHGENDVSWIGLTLSNDRHWSLAPLGMDLYDGLPGVVLFLAYLGAITREERYITLARRALTALRRQAERSQSFFTLIGGFNGWGGVIYTLAHLGILWNQPALWAEAEAIVDRLPKLIERDEQLDVIGGAAGCIGSLVTLQQCAPSERTLAAAIQCGDHLIAHARQMEHGLGWITPAGTTPLAGFSHGAAGIAWALLELAALTGEERFRTTALAAIEYERNLFSPEGGNWVDLRDLEDPGQATSSAKATFMTAWCHGAPGIGLARLHSLPHMDDRATRAEIDAALKTTLAQGFGDNHSLCHGDFGNLELLLQASEMFTDPEWRAQVNRLAAMILEDIERNGWRCANPVGIESPGLMTGLAGIGYGLLRLAKPKLVPAVLSLEPPKLDM
jgi:type 2 lantibiotic biosynthesis protein LanM